MALRNRRGRGAFATRPRELSRQRAFKRWAAHDPSVKSRSATDTSTRATTWNCSRWNSCNLRRRPNTPPDELAPTSPHRSGRNRTFVARLSAANLSIGPRSGVFNPSHIQGGSRTRTPDWAPRSERGVSSIPSTWTSRLGCTDLWNRTRMFRSSGGCMDHHCQIGITTTAVRTGVEPVSMA